MGHVVAGLPGHSHVQPDVGPDIGAPRRPAAGQGAWADGAGQLPGTGVQTLPQTGPQTHLQTGQEVLTSNMYSTVCSGGEELSTCTHKRYILQSRLLLFSFFFPP